MTSYTHFVMLSWHNVVLKLEIKKIVHLTKILNIINKPPKNLHTHKIMKYTQNFTPSKNQLWSKNISEPTNRKLIIKKISILLTVYLLKWRLFMRQNIKLNKAPINVKIRIISSWKQNKVILILSIRFMNFLYQTIYIPLNKIHSAKYKLSKRLHWNNQFKAVKNLIIQISINQIKS